MVRIKYVYENDIIYFYMFIIDKVMVLGSLCLLFIFEVLNMDWEKNGVLF